MSLIRADAINIPLQDGTVDLIVTSPPYFALRSYTDGGEHYDGQIGSEPTPQDFLEALWAVTAECARVLKPSGSIWVNLGDKYSGVNPGSYRRDKQPVHGKRDYGSGYTASAAASERAADHRPDFGGIPAKSLMGLPWRYAIGCIDQLGLILRAEVIWSKPNGLPESVTDRVRRSHEQWFHFTKEPRYYAAVDEVREAHAPKTLTHRGGGEAHGNSRNPDNNFGSSKPRVVDPLGKLPGSVWTIPSEPLKVPDSLGVDHFAAYPQEWPRRIILGWSPPGICTRCGDGRRPVVEQMNEDYAAERERVRANRTTRTKAEVGTGKADGGRTNTAGFGLISNGVVRPEPTITGYACQCPEPDAPTRPAVVLDPFGGTGTTAMVARALGRYPVHLDLSADYLRLAQWRVYESGHAAKTVTRTNGERRGAGRGDLVNLPAVAGEDQLDLFGGAA